ncbi:hypothetical protein DA2_1003 [Desulfovibrio sp. A2]|nr:hypothetical protein DA2_1003 [Desulfovibrio sp. A2]
MLPLCNASFFCKVQTSSMRFFKTCYEFSTRGGTIGRLSLACARS